MKSLILFLKSLTIIFLAVALFSKANAIGSRIIGGQTSNAGQFPSTAAITVQTSNSKYFCGGVLLDINWVITSGHCANGATLFTIELGTHNLEAASDYREIVTTSEYILHPNFDASSFMNDIALIKLREPISYNLYVQPTRLPWNDVKDGPGVLAVGWGQTSDSAAGLSDTLQYTDVSVITYDECRGYYGNQIDNNTICVIGNYNEGTCTGDTGSPLYELYIYHVYVTMGISSFISGNGCESTDPSGYTRIYPFNNWIKNVTGTP